MGPRIMNLIYFRRYLVTRNIYRAKLTVVAGENYRARQIETANFYHTIRNQKFICFCHLSRDNYFDNPLFVS